jgi:hypothetical protein
VLLARADPPAELLESLRLRSVTVVRRADAFGAMAELIRLEASTAPLILLVLEPDSAPRAAELARSVERYAPHAVCWRYDAGLKPALRGFVPPPEAPAPRDEHRARGPKGSGEPRLRLAGVEAPAASANGRRSEPVESGASARMEGPSDPAPDRPADLLSEAELAMLLATDPPGTGPTERQEGR